MIDHDTRKVVGYINSRKTEDVVRTLLNFENVEIVTRDRSSSFGSAINKGIPNAKQVADYMHLLMNQTDKIKEFLKSKLPNILYFDENFNILENKKESKYKLKRNKVINIMYHLNLRKLKRIEQKMIKVVFEKYPFVKIIFSEVKKFKSKFKSKDVKSFVRLIKKWSKSEISVLQTYTKGIYQDFDAVKNAVELGITNGIAEGKINKLKTIKRMVYGRASDALLEARILLSESFPIN